MEKHHDEPTETQFREQESHAARLSWWCTKYDVAPDTLNKLLPSGHGPEVFTIGRRRFVLRERWHERLDRLSRTGGIRVKDVTPQPAPLQRRNLRGRPRKAGTLEAKAALHEWVWRRLQPPLGKCVPAQRRPLSRLRR